MTAIIVSGFSGVGKSKCTKAYATSSKFLDADAVHFGWMKGDDDKFLRDDDNNIIRNPEFPQNYIQHVKDNMPSMDIIFVSCHEPVREALVDAGLPYILVYPERDLKDEYMERYISRGSPQPFADYIATNWDSFMDQLQAQKGCKHLVLQSGEYLGNMLHCVRDLAKTSGNTPIAKP